MQTGRSRAAGCMRNPHEAGLIRGGHHEGTNSVKEFVRLQPALAARDTANLQMLGGQ